MLTNLVSAGGIEALLSASVDCPILSVSRDPSSLAEYDPNLYLVTTSQVLSVAY